MTSWMSFRVKKRAFLRRIRIKYVALCAVALLPVAGFSAEPPDCSGYPEERVFLLVVAVG